MKRSKLTAFLMFALCAVVNAEPRFVVKCEKTSKDWNTRVVTIQSLVHDNVYDYDGDGQINCKDHAVLFKIYWDKYYKEDDCKIVRNYNPHNGFNHLFVMVWDDKLCKYIDIEPQNPDGIYVHKYRCMKCMWGSKYDPYYNYYNETKHWLAGNHTIGIKYEDTIK